MFFNNLREEIKEELIRVFGDKFSTLLTTVISGAVDVALLSNKSIEELITKYHRKKWSDISPFEARLLKEKFSLIERRGFTPIYDAHYFYMSDWIEDTLTEILKHQKAEKCKKKSIPDKEILIAIKAILYNQKSTVKAISLIKEVLKDVE